MTEHNLRQIEQAVVECERCPDLRDYCARVGLEKRRAYADWDYWARPVPGFGDRRATILIVGLAPGAHGANRTGRMFTGDRSGDFLYAALHRAGLANQSRSTKTDDGLELHGVYITAALRCAPPGNKPVASQLENCAEYLQREIELMRPRVLLCLGGIGWKAALGALDTLGPTLPRPRPKFVHGGECVLEKATLLGCYHVSQQNTFTGRLTEPMIDVVLARASEIADGS